MIVDHLGCTNVWIEPILSPFCPFKPIYPRHGARFYTCGVLLRRPRAMLRSHMEWGRGVQIKRYITGPLSP